MVPDFEHQAEFIIDMEYSRAGCSESTTAGGEKPSSLFITIIIRSSPRSPLTDDVQLNCCGYLNSTSPAFIEDAVCRNPQVAASKVGCVKPFSTLANNFLDLVFTGAFGIVGVDMLLILTLAIVLKDRKEKERYRHIDEKNGEMAFQACTNQDPPGLLR